MLAPDSVWGSFRVGRARSGRRASLCLPSGEPACRTSGEPVLSTVSDVKDTKDVMDIMDTKGAKNTKEAMDTVLLCCCTLLHVALG